MISLLKPRLGKKVGNDEASHSLGHSSFALSCWAPFPGEAFELTCASTWNRMSETQKVSFMLGFNEGVTAALAVTDLSESAIKRILPSVWPSTNAEFLA